MRVISKRGILTEINSLDEAKKIKHKIDSIDGDKCIGKCLECGNPILRNSNFQQINKQLFYCSYCLMEARLKK